MQMHVCTYYPESVAIRNGHAEAGQLFVPIDADALASLSPEQRAVIADYSRCVTATQNQYQKTLNVKAPGWQGVVSAVDQLLAKIELDKKEAEQREQDDAKALERRIVEYLATTSSYRPFGNCRYETYPSAPYRSDSDPRVAARLEIESAEIQRLEQQARETLASAEAAKTAAKKARQDALRAAIVEGSIAVPLNVERAASEGRDVDGAIESVVKERLLQTLESIMADGTPGAVVVHKVYDSETRTDVPSVAAYSVLDDLTAAWTLLERCVPAKAGKEPIKLQISIGDISRFDVDPRRGHNTYRTGVCVTAKTPLLDTEFEAYVLAEPLALEPDEDSDD